MKKHRRRTTKRHPRNAGSARLGRKPLLFNQFKAYNQVEDAEKAELWVNPSICGYDEVIAAFGSEASAKRHVIDMFNTLRVFDLCIDLSNDECPFLDDLLECKRGQPEGYRPYRQGIQFLKVSDIAKVQLPDNEGQTDEPEDDTPLPVPTDQ
ncbi:MAG: hypothetical protein Q8N51_13795 [Gammaproteobacteria bacterium]|nr:hypothetical protein [Gammaproteobacteria bacterium]